MTESRIIRIRETEITRITGRSSSPWATGVIARTQCWKVRGSKHFTTPVCAGAEARIATQGVQIAQGIAGARCGRILHTDQAGRTIGHICAARLPVRCRSGRETNPHGLGIQNDGEAPVILRTASLRRPGTADFGARSQECVIGSQIQTDGIGLTASGLSGGRGQIAHISAFGDVLGLTQTEQAGAAIPDALTTDIPFLECPYAEADALCGVGRRCRETSLALRTRIEGRKWVTELITSAQEGQFRDSEILTAIVVRTASRISGRGVDVTHGLAETARCRFIRTEQVLTAVIGDTVAADGRFCKGSDISAQSIRGRIGPAASGLVAMSRTLTGGKGCTGFITQAQPIDTPGETDIIGTAACAVGISRYICGIAHLHALTGRRVLRIVDAHRTFGAN